MYIRLTACKYFIISTLLLLSYTYVNAATATPSTVTCPQVNGNYEWGQIFYQNGRLWHASIIEGEFLQINTAADTTYGTTTPTNVLVCAGEHQGKQYNFQALIADGTTCVQTDKMTFTCQKKVVSTKVNNSKPSKQNYKKVKTKHTRTTIHAS